jgi:phospholipid-binding lipoprotein MlaA
LLPLDPTIEKAYDPYAFIRDAYLQRRAFLVSDGKGEPDNTLVDPGDDSATAPPDPSSKRDAAEPAGAPRKDPPDE